MGQNWGHLSTKWYCRIIQKYTSQWIDQNYVLVFTVCLGKAQIFTDFPQKVNKSQKWQQTRAICLLPVGKSVNIWAIPRYTVKTKLYLWSIVKYFSVKNISWQMSSIFLHASKYLFLINHHCKLKSEGSDHYKFSQNWICFLQCDKRYTSLSISWMRLDTQVYTQK